MMMNHLTIVMSRLGPGIPMLQYRMLPIMIPDISRDGRGDTCTCNWGEPITLAS